MHRFQIRSAGATSQQLSSEEKKYIVFPTDYLSVMRDLESGPTEVMGQELLQSPVELSTSNKIVQRIPAHVGIKGNDKADYLASQRSKMQQIKGYVILNKENKRTQFAEDTLLVVDGSKESFEYCVRTVIEYTTFSGFAMNFDKTKVVWFGCEHPINTNYMPHLKFEWNPKSFTI